MEHPLFPELAIRELVANALIHQDMTITGAGPQINEKRLTLRALWDSEAKRISGVASN